MQVTHAHTVFTFSIAFASPVLLSFRDEPRLFATRASVSVKVADGALTTVATTFDAKGFAPSQTGDISRRRSSWQGTNLAALPADARDAVRAALLEAAGPVEDLLGQLDGFRADRR